MPLRSVTLCFESWCPTSMANKLGLYWSAPGRKFRRTREEVAGNLFVCPRCRGQMVKKVYKHIDDGGKAHLLVCPNAECLFLIKFDNILDNNTNEVTEVSVPDVTDFVEDDNDEPQVVTAKTAKIDLKEFAGSVGGKFTSSFIDDDILELKNRFGFPKTVYLNSDGDVWSDDPDAGYAHASSEDDAQKKIRELTASKGDVFAAKELVQLFASCGCNEQPELLEDVIQVQGGEMAQDILNEPEVVVLELSPENQDQLATMVFDSLLNTKEQDLETFEPHLASKLATHLNHIFENLSFLDLGNGSIKVTFDNKFARVRPTRQDLIDLLKTASEGVDISDFYKQVVTDFSKKVSEKLPDYFFVRKEVVSEVMEQINAK
jgi:hypothetical protein